MEVVLVEIDKNKIPYEFEILLNGETFQIEVFYNTVGDFFTVDLYKNHNPVVYGEKLVLGVPLFESLQHLEVPKIQLIPYDITMPRLKANRVTYENLGEDVFLYALDTTD